MPNSDLGIPQNTTGNGIPLDNVNLGHAVPIFWGNDQFIDEGTLAYTPPANMVQGTLHIPKVCRFLYSYGPATDPIENLWENGCVAPGNLGGGSIRVSSGINDYFDPVTFTFSNMNDVISALGQDVVMNASLGPTWVGIGLAWASGFWRIRKTKIVEHPNHSETITRSIILTGGIDVSGNLTGIPVIGPPGVFHLSEEGATRTGTHNSGDFRLEFGYQVQASPNGTDWPP